MSMYSELRFAITTTSGCKNRIASNTFARQGVHVSLLITGEPSCKYAQPGIENTALFIPKFAAALVNPSLNDLAMESPTKMAVLSPSGFE